MPRPHGCAGAAQLKTPYRDGTTHVIFEPSDFIARLAAAVPGAGSLVPRGAMVAIPSLAPGAIIGGRCSCGEGTGLAAAEFSHLLLRFGSDWLTRRRAVAPPTSFSRSVPHADSRRPGPGGCLLPAESGVRGRTGTSTVHEVGGTNRAVAGHPDRSGYAVYVAASGSRPGFGDFVAGRPVANGHARTLQVGR